jgi:hypothetical protein
MEALVNIQSELKAPKNQFNAFGKYKYRNCEDILEALKPILLKHKAILTISDEIKDVMGMLFVESTCRLICDKQEITVRAQAGIDTQRKGMDVAQCYGASSSYARKYALNGLFLIDDTKDPDSNEVPPNKENPPSSAPQPTSGKTPQKPLLTDVQFESLMKMDALALVPLIPKYEEKFIIKPDWLAQLKAKV